ncbi:MAG: GTP-sensing pleiotropic transcriptional regulator CodY [Lachnospiraceae bacterium]|nr:GTP-sensing pleiotropic transcriptional regulator CodY [Lachnospiraceae bacterium]
MSSVKLLDKTRKIGKLLHNNSSTKVVFNDICHVMTEILSSNVLVISKKGKILGLCQDRFDKLEGFPVSAVGQMASPELSDRLLSILSTKENVNLETLGFGEEEAKKYCTVITPIDIAGERLGSLFVYREKDMYDIDDIILCEYGATVVGLEMMRSVNEEQEEVFREEHMVRSSLETLSKLEKKAVHLVMNELPEGEGLLVASKIADREKMTRSVIVNALRKLESAGIIACHSAGMKGTYIKVVNDMFYEVLKDRT